MRPHAQQQEDTSQALAVQSSYGPQLLTTQLRAKITLFWKSTWCTEYGG